MAILLKLFELFTLFFFFMSFTTELQQARAGRTTNIENLGSIFKSWISTWRWRDARLNLFPNCTSRSLYSRSISLEVGSTMTRPMEIIISDRYDFQWKISDETGSSTRRSTNYDSVGTSSCHLRCEVMFCSSGRRDIKFLFGFHVTCNGSIIYSFFL